MPVPTTILETVGQFMKGPFVAWFNKWLDDSVQSITYKDIVDGLLMHKVFILMLESIQATVDRIKCYSEEEASRFLQLPEIAELSENMDCDGKEAKLSLQLLLQKISRQVQSSIIDCIKGASECHNIVTNEGTLSDTDMAAASTKMIEWVEEFGKFRENKPNCESQTLNEISFDKTSLTIKDNEEASVTSNFKSQIAISMDKLEDNLNEWEAELSKYNEELHQSKFLVEDLLLEAKAAKSCKHDVIIANDKVERLQMEVYSLKEKLNNYKEVEMELNELSKQNKVLGDAQQELKDDFTKLLSVNNNLKEENLNYRQELHYLLSQQSQIQSEVINKNKKILELDERIQKLNEDNYSLLQINASLENDIKFLMAQLSQQKVSYQDLKAPTTDTSKLLHNQSREDLETTVTELFNDLRKQKEQIREKIMKHYEQLDSSLVEKEELQQDVERFDEVKGAETKDPERLRRENSHSSEKIQKILDLHSDTDTQSSDEYRKVALSSDTDYQSSDEETCKSCAEIQMIEELERLQKKRRKCKVTI